MKQDKTRWCCTKICTKYWKYWKSYVSFQLSWQIWLFWAVLKYFAHWVFFSCFYEQKGYKVSAHDSIPTSLIPTKTCVNIKKNQCILYLIQVFGPAEIPSKLVFLPILRLQLLPACTRWHSLHTTHWPKRSPSLSIHNSYKVAFPAPLLVLVEFLSKNWNNLFHSYRPAFLAFSCCQSVLDFYISYFSESLNSREYKLLYVSSYWSWLIHNVIKNLLSSL